MRPKADPLAAVLAHPRFVRLEPLSESEMRCVRDDGGTSGRCYRVVLLGRDGETRELAGTLDRLALAALYLLERGP